MITTELRPFHLNVALEFLSRNPCLPDRSGLSVAGLAGQREGLSQREVLAYIWRTFGQIGHIRHMEDLQNVSNRTLDTTGLTCPIPILKAKKALADLAQGATLEILATDPAAPKDFVAFCKATGNVLVETTEQAGTYRIVIQKA